MTQEGEKMSSEPGSYTYTILPITQNEKVEALEFLKLTFFRLEPINQGVGLCDSGERCEVLEEYCLHDMCSGFSLRAVDEQGDIVAVMVSGVEHNTDQTYKELTESAQRCADEKFRRILQLLCARESTCQLWKRMPHVSSFLEVKVAATHPAWGRRGIMTAMLKQTELLARAHNYKLIRMDTSSAYSARVAEKLGFQCVSRLLYKDVKVDGEVLTKPPHPHVEDRVNVKILSDL